MAEKVGFEPTSPPASRSEQKTVQATRFRGGLFQPHSMAGEVAERVGFEPTSPFYQATRFRGGLFQPLRHLSASAWSDSRLANSPKSNKPAPGC